MNQNFVVLALLCAFSLCAQAQEKEKHGASVHQESAPDEKDSRFPEAEFFASDVFRSASYVQPVWKRLHLEGHYFGQTDIDVGHAGASWGFRWNGLMLAPGFGVMFGSNGFKTTPAVSFRWNYERKWFVTQGLILQGFRESPAGEAEQEGAQHQKQEGMSLSYRPSIADGNHVSARWKRLTLGGTWEHIHFREGNEWKGGGRVAVRLARHLSGVLFVFGPGRAEFRGGVVIHPAAD